MQYSRVWFFFTLNLIDTMGRRLRPTFIFFSPTSITQHHKMLRRRRRRRTMTIRVPSQRRSATFNTCYLDGSRIAWYHNNNIYTYIIHMYWRSLRYIVLCTYYTSFGGRTCRESVDYFLAQLSAAVDTDDNNNNNVIVDSVTTVIFWWSQVSKLSLVGREGEEDRTSCWNYDIIILYYIVRYCNLFNNIIK
jgi:hypothetical protein